MQRVWLLMTLSSSPVLSPTVSVLVASVCHSLPPSRSCREGGSAEPVLPMDECGHQCLIP
jgi:hypothetical protein